MASCLRMIQGSSISPALIDQVRALAANYSCVLICLDSNHTHEHLLAESEAYAPLTSMGSYCLASRDTSNCVDFWRRTWAREGVAATARIVTTR